MSDPLPALLRFIVLNHDHPEPHWDFMLEAGETLRTWRLAMPPEIDGPISAVPLPDHRRLYLDYEGPVSGNRGHVTRWDGGTYEVLRDQPDLFQVRLIGDRLCGTAKWQPARGVWEFRGEP